ncbi:MAG: hypothetical protein JSS02_25180 [Planctomycetes bacterium]|nr:hypothetical protein [Planctomycetota bacterium]
MEIPIMGYAPRGADFVLYCEIIGQSSTSVPMACSVPFRALGIAVCAAVLAGCHGEEREQVRYSQVPSDAEMQSVPVPDWERGAEPGPVTAISFLRPLHADEALAIEGRIHFPGATAFGIVNVSFSTPVGDPAPIVVAGGNAVAEAEGDGWFTYRIELKAPNRPNCRCEVRVTDVKQNLIATGEVDVE